MKLSHTSQIRFSLGFLTLFVSLSLAAQRYAPEDLEVPVFDSTGFIIDPDNGISDEWRTSMHGSRKTYFFARYVEPVCVRVDGIKSPANIDSYADKLVELWDLESKTNGRFVFQIAVISKKQIVYRFGSRVERFYEDEFLDSLKADIESVHFSGSATGTGSFVSISKLGSNIFEQIAYDTRISAYKNGNHIHAFYPDEVEVSPDGTLTTMETSAYVSPESNAGYESDHVYFTPLSSEEAEANYARINTEGVITDINLVNNPREENNTLVEDPHFLLSARAERMIDSILWKVEDSTGYQCVVVCLNSIGDANAIDYVNARVFGTDLYNLWEVGNKETDKGLLMLLVNDVHRIEFITGYGAEPILTDAMCYDIQQEEMVPHFKNNDYVTGMIRGSQAIADVFYGDPPDYYSYDSSNDDYYYDDYESEPYVPTPFWERPIVRIYMFVALGFGGLWVVFLLLSLFMKSLHKRYHTMKLFSLVIFPILMPLPFAIIYFINKSFMERWRNTVRFSSNTGEMMHRLGESEDDKHLTKGQISEEKVNSIDYDVWITPGATEVLILKYARWFSEHRKCPSCKYKTYFKVYNKTIVSPTYSSSGTGEKKYKCDNCGHQKVTRYTIAKLQRSSGGSSSGGYSSSGGGGGGYSSGGGGSSFGGGSSGGGGAGSSW